MYVGTTGTMRANAPKDENPWPGGIAGAIKFMHAVTECPVLIYNDSIANLSHSGFSPMDTNIFLRLAMSSCCRLAMSSCCHTKTLRGGGGTSKLLWEKINVIMTLGGGSLGP